MASEIGKIVHCKICGAPIEARGNRLYCPVCYNQNRRNAAQRSNARTKMEREQTKREEAKMKENNRIATSAAELNMRAKLSNLGGISYAYVPAVYDGVNNVLTAVTGKQVGVPAPIPSNTGDGNAPTVSQPQLQQSSGTSENALNGIDLSGDVTIEFYATVRTADGREYKVPLSSANLTDGNLKSLLDGSGFTLTSGQ